MAKQATILEIIKKQIRKDEPFVLTLYNRKTEERLEAGFEVFEILGEIVDDKPIKFGYMDDDWLYAEFSVEYLKEIIRRVEEIA